MTPVLLAGPGVEPLMAIPTSAGLGMLGAAPTNVSLTVVPGRPPDRNAGKPLENATEHAFGGTAVNNGIRNLSWDLRQVAFGSTGCAVTRYVSLQYPSSR